MPFCCQAHMVAPSAKARVEIYISLRPYSLVLSLPARKHGLKFMPKNSIISISLSLPAWKWELKLHILPVFLFYPEAACGKEAGMEVYLSQQKTKDWNVQYMRITLIWESSLLPASKSPQKPYNIVKFFTSFMTIFCEKYNSIFMPVKYNYNKP